ncbi:MAG: MBL fold metallo-hydrolase [Ruminococcus flavefaciens]|nr:MBL fold metallo-hydrolase [Ruminococcus flavefaciens]
MADFKLSDEQKKKLGKYAKETKQKYDSQNPKQKRKTLIKAVPVILLMLIGFLVWNISGCDLLSGSNEELTVHYIDVGQGDSIYITSGGEGMLIDCGESGDTDRVISYLDNMGVSKIDYVVGTHPHSDHMGGMSKIVEHYEIGEMIIPHIDDSDTPTTKYFERFLKACADKNLSLTEAELGRKITIGDAELKIIAPNSDDYSNVNNYSVSFIMHHGDNSFIFTGDAEKLAEKEMIESGNLEDIDVYKTGHHGSDTSSSEDFLNVIKPDYAVISCGEGNSYGHPCDITIENLSKFTDKIYRTDLVGTVVFTSDGKKLDVKTERN